MNNAGLESSIYEQLRGYSEALNHYLVKLKTESPSSRFVPPREVADLVRGLGESVPNEVSVQLLSSGLQERGAFPPSVVKRLRPPSTPKPWPRKQSVTLNNSLTI
ncbi:MAG: hypothetical protein QM760_16120 [Nibricoccus sp.]